MSDNQNGQDRKSIIEKSMERLRELMARGVHIDRKTIEKVLMATGAGILVGGAVIAADYIDKNEKGGDSTHAVVKNVYTNLYKTLPSRNRVDSLDKNELIVFQKGQTKEWTQRDGDSEKTHVFIKVDKAIKGMEIIDEENEVITTPQNINNTKRYSNSDLYVLQSSIDTYVECDHTPLLKFRKKANTDDPNPMFASEGTLYVCLDSEGIGSHNFKKAVLVLANGDIEHGYVADENEYITEKEESTTCIGIANDYTYLRDSAALPEYDADYIECLINNGEVIEITGEADQYCYSCKIAGDDENEYFIRKNTVIVFDDFDYEVEYDAGDFQYTGAIYGFANDGSLVERANKDGSISTISNGDTLKVDINSSKDGYYSVYDEANGVVGFVDGRKMREKDSGKTIYEMLDIDPAKNKKKDNVEPETTVETNNEDETKSTSEADYEGETNSTTEGTSENSSVVDGENKATITLDAKYFTIEDLKKLLAYYEEQNVEVSAVEFSIGATGTGADLGICNIKDTDEIFEKYKEDPQTMSIQKIWDEMEQKNGASVGTQKNESRGNMGELIESIEYLIDKNIAVGMYYYSAPQDESEVSCEAAYIYSVRKYLNEYSEKYRNYDRKLPLCIDIECGGAKRESTSNTRRAELTQRLIELLGSGVSVNSDKYFCVDGKDVSTGYGVVAKEKGVMVYGDMRNTGDKLLDLLNSPNGVVKDYWEMKQNLEDDGYNVYPWMSCQFSTVVYDGASNYPLEKANTPGDTEKEIDKIKDMSKALADLKTTVANRASTEQNKDLYNQAAIIQVLLQRSVGGFGHDISVVSKENIETILAGNAFPEDYSFENAFSDAIEAMKESEIENNEAKKQTTTSEETNKNKWFFGLNKTASDAPNAGEDDERSI